MSDAPAALRAARRKNLGPTAVYRFFDAYDNLLYVGLTSQIPERWLSHSREKLWWQEAVRATIEHFDTRDLAEVAERRAIRMELPKYNIQSRPGLRGPAPRPTPPLAPPAEAGKADWIGINTAARILGMTRMTVWRSLSNTRRCADLWGTEGAGWRRKPLSARGIYEVNRARAEELAGRDKPAAE